MSLLFFFLNDTATTEIYTLSLHDALPISSGHRRRPGTRRPPQAPARVPPDGRVPRIHDLEQGRRAGPEAGSGGRARRVGHQDRKSTRLNSSHGYISYAVFCLKKKKYSI